MGGSAQGADRRSPGGCRAAAPVGRDRRPGRGCRGSPRTSGAKPGWPIRRLRATRSTSRSDSPTRPTPRVQSSNSSGPTASLPELVLIGGDEFGELGGLEGSDSFMLVAEAANATVFSVGIEPHGVPDGVVHLPGGPRAVPRRAARPAAPPRRMFPESREGEGWSLIVPAFAPAPEHDHEALALHRRRRDRHERRAAPLARRLRTAEVMAAGIYDGDGPLTDLLPGPHWARARACARARRLRAPHARPSHGRAR